MWGHHANGEDYSPEDLTLSFYCLLVMKVWAIYFNSIHLSFLIYCTVSINIAIPVFKFACFCLKDYGGICKTPSNQGPQSEVLRLMLDNPCE